MLITAKLLLPIGIYRGKLQLSEAMEKEVASNNIESEKELSQLFNTLAMDHYKEILIVFFAMSKEDRLVKIKTMGT